MTPLIDSRIIGHGEDIYPGRVIVLWEAPGRQETWTHCNQGHFVRTRYCNSAAMKNYIYGWSLVTNSVAGSPGVA